jgi:hypothetical protein
MGLRERFEQMTEAWNAHEFDGVVTAFSEDCEVTAPDFTGQGTRACATGGTTTCGVPEVG